MATPSTINRLTSGFIAKFGKTPAPESQGELPEGVSIISKDSQADGFGILPRHAFLILRVPPLPPEFNTAGVMKVLSVMSVRPVSPFWFAKHTKLSHVQSRRLLAALDQAGVLQILDIAAVRSRHAFADLPIERMLSGV